MKKGKLIVLRTWARRIHSSTGVPSHVCTQQGRVNAQQGRCPLNLKGFLNANANTSPSIKASTGRDRSTIRVIARARNKRDDRFAIELEQRRFPGSHLASCWKIAGHELRILYRDIADIAIERGFLAFPVSYAFFFFLPFSLSSERTGSDCRPLAEIAWGACSPNLGLVCP